MRTLPAYVSWNSFCRTLDTLGPRLSDPLDAASFGLSPSSASQMLQAFKFLGLLASDGQTSPDLRLIVEHPDSRPAVLSKVLRQAYPELFSPGASRLSSKSVEEFMRRTGLSPATQRKAASFLYNAAAFIQVPIEDTSPSYDLPTDPPPAIPLVSRRSLTVELASGGIVEVSVDFDPFRLDRQDRDFLFDLIDRLRSYRLDRHQADRETQTRDEQEVPF